MCILGITGIIPILGIIACIAGFICWIVYWVKIAGYSRELLMHSMAAYQA